MMDSDPMPNATEILREDHRNVRNMLANLEEADEGNARIQMLNRLEKHLVVHERIEEEVFYPTVRERADREGVVSVLEAREEHHLLDEVMRDMRAVEADSDQFTARLHVLRTILDHHMDEEEERLFPMAEDMLDDDARGQLARRLDDERERLMGTDLSALRRHSAFAGTPSGGRTP